MIIEKFRPGKVKLLYQRLDEKGRSLTEGVTYVNNWTDENITTCYQVMESETIEKIYQWIKNWNALVDFEVIPVITSAEAKAKVLSQ